MIAFPHRQLVLTVLLLAAGIMSPVSAHASDPNPPGNIAVSVQVTYDSQFASQWGSQPHETFVFPKPLKEIERGKKFFIAVIVTGYGVNGIGMTDLLADILITGPEGKEVYQEANCFENKQDLHGNKEGFVLMDPVVEWIFSGNDPAGKYKIKITVNDKKLTRSSLVEYSVTLK